MAGQPGPRAQVEASGPFRALPAFELGELDGHWIVTSLSREVGGPTVVFFDVTIYVGKTHLDLEIRDETSEVTAACGVLTVGVGGADGTSAGKFRVVIEESGSVSSFQGRFVLYAPASTDSGTSALQVQIGPVRYRGGQRYEIHSGVDTMHGKKGGL